MKDPIIQIDRLVKEYEPGHRAIDELSLQVFPGEIFGFLGANGAGKTSTLKILTTLTKPTSGRATVAGFDVVGEPKKVRSVIGYVGQQAGVDMVLTGRENLLLQGQLFHLPKSEILNRTDELLTLFGLGEAADGKVGAYSGGMKRKLDIATALIHRPKVLFLDEPTLGLDPQSRSALWTYIQNLNRDHQMAVFLTTHYLEEADRLSHRLAIVDRGRLKALGTSDELKDTLAGDGIHLTFEEVVGSQELSLLRQGGMVREVIQEEKEVHLYLENGRGALPKLLQILEQIKAPVRTIALSRPSLDDVFLKYTGHTLGKEQERPAGGNPWWPGGNGGGSQKWQRQWAKSEKETDGSPSGEWKQTEGSESGSSGWPLAPQDSSSGSSWGLPGSGKRSDAPSGPPQKEGAWGRWDKSEEPKKGKEEG